MNKIPEITFDNKNPSKIGFEITRIEELINSSKMESKLGKVHKLTFFAIMFIDSGKGQHNIDFRNYNFKKGDIIFISNEQVHSFSQDKSYKGYLILFTDEFLMKSLSNQEMRAFSSLYNYQIYNPIVQVGNEFYEDYLRLIQDIKIEYHAKDDHLKEDILRNKLKVLLLKSERFKNNDSQIVNSKYYSEFLQFQNLLKVNIKTEYQVQFYANKLFMSSKKLNTITKEILGSSVKKVISDIRTLKIKRSLLDLSQSIKEIAFEFGFDEHTNFVKFFKKQTGISPSDFRELNQ